jgi:hypothetical protein
MADSAVALQEYTIQCAVMGVTPVKCSPEGALMKSWATTAASPNNTKTLGEFLVALFHPPIFSFARWILIRHAACSVDDQNADLNAKRYQT